MYHFPARGIHVTRDSLSILSVYAILFLGFFVVFILQGWKYQLHAMFALVALGQPAYWHIFFRRCRLCGKHKFLPDVAFKFLPPDCPCVHCHGDDNQYNEDSQVNIK
jgi:hypothetical protein